MGASHDLAPAWNRHCSKPTGCGLPLLLSMDGTDRQTDGQYTQSLHRPCSSCYAGSVSNEESYAVTERLAKNGLVSVTN